MVGHESDYQQIEDKCFSHFCLAVCPCLSFIVLACGQKYQLIRFYIGVTLHTALSCKVYFFSTPEPDVYDMANARLFVPVF